MSLIEVKNFYKSFGGKTVHQGVSFSVEEGECLGLIGGSGSGKSVLLRSLIGLEKPSQGSIFFEQEDITFFKERDFLQVRKKIAYVFQGGALFDSMTVYENLAYPLRAHTPLLESEIRKRIRFQLEEFGLHGSEELYPSSLSGGMQKRVGLARSIILSPKVILYDEPTAGLDPYNTKRIQDMIIQMKSKGCTSILVSHDMPVAFSVCDRVALLRNGKIEITCPIDRIKSLPKDHSILKFANGEIN